MIKKKRKIKKKGFTLVELLAVIVILAIVVGIAIPSVTGIINNSKKKGFETAVEAAGTWLQKQAQMMNVSAAAVDPTFKKIVKTTPVEVTYYTAAADGSYAAADTVDLWQKLGFKSQNVRTIKVGYNSDGTACIRIVQIPTFSEYHTVKHWDAATPAGPKEDIKATYGTGCE